MRGWASTVTALAMLLGAGACSAEEQDGGTATGQRSPSPAATATAPASPGPAQPAPSPEATQVATGETAYFLSPTRNIVCSLAAANAACEIAEHSFTPPPKPADCDLDHGTMVGLEGAGPATFLCHGDTAFGADDTPVLPYGGRMTTGLVTCTSSESGVACTTADGAHGFELARAAYRVY